VDEPATAPSARGGANADAAPDRNAERAGFREPWRLAAGDVATALEVDPERGLAATEAVARLARAGPNELEPERRPSAWRRFAAQFADPLVRLLLVAVAVSFAAWLVDGRHGVPFEVIVITGIVVGNAILGYVQQAHAEEAVAALQRMAATTAAVVRDGRVVRVPAATVVPGDILLLSEGDTVAADGRLLESASLTVSEASLTGESQPVAKHTAPLPRTTEAAVPADRTNMVFRGTAVGRGRGRAVVTATGMATEMGGVARLLGRTREEQTPLERDVDRIGRSLGVAVVAIAVVVVAAILATSDVDGVSGAVDVLLIGVSLAVAAVPEGLPAVLSVVLSLGVQRMARERAIVKKLASVETLGSASVVCTDKTGTLTRNEMTITTVATPSGHVDVSGEGYRPVGELTVGGLPADDPVLLEEARTVLVAGSLAGDATLSEERDGWVVHGDPTDGAFLVAEAKLGGNSAGRARFRRLEEVPFTSERRLLSSIEADPDGDVTLFTKGAPGAVLERCTHELRAGVAVPLTDGRRHEILATVERLAERALRTLAVARRSLPPDHGAATATATATGTGIGVGEALERELVYLGVATGTGIGVGEALERELVYLGVAGIIDPPRAEAAPAIEEAHAAGIRVVMITGDHPATALRIATDLGVVGDGSGALSGADLEALDDTALTTAARTVAVYARVTPEHKLRIVDALQADGQVVAMTGDGVNDAPALRSADIGVAMGVTGTDVTKEAADMILADDNFATIVAAVREGRAIFSGIRTFLRFLLSSNIGEVLTMLLGVVLAGWLGLEGDSRTIAVPLLASQILWINLVTDTGPALALGVDPPPDDVMRRPPRPPGERVLDRRMWWGVVSTGAVMAAATLLALDLRLPGGIVHGSGDVTQARTMAFTTLVLAQLFNCLASRSDRTSAFVHPFTNRWLWAALAVSVTLQVAVVQIGALNAPFSTTPLGPRDWLACAGLASVVLWATEVRKGVARATRAVRA